MSVVVNAILAQVRLLIAVCVVLRVTVLLVRTAIMFLGADATLIVM